MCTESLLCPHNNVVCLDPFADVVGQMVVIAAPLVPVLIECWADCSPTVCSGPMPNAANLSCMISITQALSLLFQCFALEGSTASSSWRFDKRSLLFSSEQGEEEWDMRVWMRQQFLPGLEKHVLIVFPIAAPSIRLPAKVHIIKLPFHMKLLHKLSLTGVLGLITSLSGCI